MTAYVVVPGSPSQEDKIQRIEYLDVYERGVHIGISAHIHYQFVNGHGECEDVLPSREAAEQWVDEILKGHLLTGRVIPPLQALSTKRMRDGFRITSHTRAWESTI